MRWLDVVVVVFEDWIFFCNFAKDFENELHLSIPK